MSDDRLRELERRWRASGDLDDEVALVQERLRAGAVEADRVSLAAGLGHPGAQAVVGPTASLLDQLVRRYDFTSEGERRWRWNAVTGCDARWPHGDDALLRVAASAARHGLRAWTTFAANEPDLRADAERPARDLRDLVAAVLAGDPLEEDAIDEILERVGTLQDLEGLDVPDAVFDALNAVAQVALLVSGRPHLRSVRRAEDLFGPPGGDEGLRDDARDDPGGWCVALAMNATGREEVEAALRHDVGAWALGHGDPLREWATR